MAKIFPHEKLDQRLDRAAAAPEKFESIADRLIRDLDKKGLGLEISDPSTWRRPEPEGQRPSSPFQQFRMDVERMIVLDREDEARLARRVEFARRRLEKARKKAGLEPQIPRDLAPTATEERMPKVVARRALELHALRTEMVERNLYLVLINVERYAQSAGNRMDLIQEGALSLFRAVDGFDWRRGLLFRTYAVHWLNQAFRNYLYNCTSTVRVPVYLQKAMKHINQAQIRLGDPNASPSQIAETADMNENLVSSALSAARTAYSIDAGLSGDEDETSRLRDLLVVEEDEEGPYDPGLEDVTLEQGLGRALERLSDRERRVVQMRFGIGHERPHTLAEVAGDLGVSVERVRQIQVRAISKMNTPGLRRELDPFLN